MQNEVKISFLGDLMYYSLFLPNPPSTPLENISSLLNESDFVIANLECPISRNFGTGAHTTGRYRFVAPVQFAEAIKNAGVTHVSVANNHCLDQQFEGLLETMDALNEIDLPYIGGKRQKSDDGFCILKKNDIRVGIISSTYGTNAIENAQRLKFWQAPHLNLSQNQELSNPFTRFLYKQYYNLYLKLKWRTNREAESWFDRKEFSFSKRRKLAKDLQQMKKRGADFIVAYPHWGGQHRLTPMQSARELGLFFTKNGANAVIGHHEHLVQIAELTPNGLCAYCLGNTLGYHGIDQRDELRLANYSIILHLYLQRRSGGDISSRYSFSIAKCVANDDGHAVCHLLNDLIESASESAEREQLLRDQAFIYKRFTGQDIDNINRSAVEFPFPQN